MAPRSSVLETLQDNVAAIFHQAQASAANHRKNLVALHKLHVQANLVTRSIKDGAAVKLLGEKAFGNAFLEMVSRIMAVRRGTAPAERIVKFIGAYVRFMNEKASEHESKRPPAASSSASLRSEEEEEETPTSRFVARLLSWLLQGFLAKNKVVRFRSVNVVSEMVSYLGEIDEDMYVALRNGLVERVHDKESLIRAHAVIALSKLVLSEDPSELDHGEMSILQIILESLCSDPAPEVRRAALLHAPLTPATLPALLSRTRDTDTLTRKLVYSTILLARLDHPRQLTIAQREEIVRDGLGDREDVVRVATGKVIGAWFDVSFSEAEKAGNGREDAILEGIEGLLRIFDIVGPGEGIAVDALKSIFVTRADVLDAVTFSESFWAELTPESALLARVFVDHCISSQDEMRLEAAFLPVVTAFAFHIQEAYNALIDPIQDEEETKLIADSEKDEESQERREEDLVAREFVLRQLLIIARSLDFTDEIGRRKLFTAIRCLLAQGDLPGSLIECCLDVLRELLPDEREFIRVIVEAVHDLRDDENGESNEQTCLLDDGTQSDITIFRKERSFLRTKQRHEMTPEERLQADVIDIRCLTLCIGMLERVNGDFEDNSTLKGILGDLIVPAVKRKELAMREKGLVSLGLCCLIAKDMALSSFQLFLNQIQNAPVDLKIKVLQIVFDILMVYDREFLGRSDEIAERIITFLLHTLENDDSSAVQAVLCIGISKLLLSGLVVDVRVLTSLVMAYVSPVTSDNHELRQCLSYFFPVYCYSSPDNQSRIQTIFIPSYDLLMDVHQDLEEDQDMITPYQLGLLFVDWTNPQKAATTKNASARGVHVDMAIDILKALYGSERNAEDQKNLVQLLSHLYIPNDIERHSLVKMHILLSHLQEQCPSENPTLNKLIERFKNRFHKQFCGIIQQLDHEPYADEDEFRELYEFIGIGVPDKIRTSGTGDGTVRSPHGASDNDQSMVSSDEEAASLPSSPTPTPKPLKHTQQTKRGPADHGNRVTHEHEEDKENVSTTPHAVTPRKGAKRMRNPVTKQVLISPVKKRNRITSPEKTMPKTRRAASSSEPEDSSDEQSILPSSTRSRRAIKVVPAVPSSDDFINNSDF